MIVICNINPTKGMIGNMDKKMTLGMISPTHDRAGIEWVASFGLKYAEFDVNADDISYLDPAGIKKSLDEFGVSLSAVGRWGRPRLNADGSVNPKEFKDETDLIDLCAGTGCPFYITGINYVEGKSLYENYTFAIAYFQSLTQYAKSRGVKVCTYNCHWNSWVGSPAAWDVIHGHIPELGIKFDPTHAIIGGRDYLTEAVKYGANFDHVHIKGTINLNGRRIDDPPAGMDLIQWPAFLSILYQHGYHGNLSIEPHSQTWRGGLGDQGIRYTIKYIRNLMFES